MRRLKILTWLGTICLLLGCGQGQSSEEVTSGYPDVQIAGAMRNVMWRGELGGVIELDSIANKQGLYGLGPVSYLQGEILLIDGQAFVSRVVSDSSMTVEETYDVAAPFLVFANVNKWREMVLPAEVQNIGELERWLDEATVDAKRPFAFKLSGRVQQADIHIQNLPPGSKVSSPEEAHRGQTNYLLEDENVDIVGFFSTEHQGVFTHHDSFLHMHLITADRQQMGHLDAVSFKEMVLYLPEG